MIIISSDSTADLNYLFEERKVNIIPLAVILNGKMYQDGVDVNPEKIYESVEETGSLPKTSARSVEEYKEYFTALKGEQNEVIHFSISSEISVTCRNAILAAEEVGGVHIVDGKSLSTGTGLLVLHACDLRDEGKYTAEEIAQKCRERVNSVEASFFVDKMDYLYKGGRCSGLASFFATALGIKPSLLLKDGKIVVGKKYMGGAEKIAKQYVNNIFKMYPNPDLKRIFITYTQGTSKKVIDIIRNEIGKYFNFETIYETIASSTITSHCGKGTIGILYINDGDKN